MHQLLILAAALVATTAYAGMYDQPYALVERGAASETRKEATLAITKVDGVGTRNSRKTDPIPPGKHRITLHVESARASFVLNSRYRARPRSLHPLPRGRQLRAQDRPGLEAQGLCRADRRMPEEIPDAAGAGAVGPAA
jgi:hypothetical protein